MTFLKKLFEKRDSDPIYTFILEKSLPNPNITLITNPNLTLTLTFTLILALTLPLAYIYSYSNLLVMIVFPVCVFLNFIVCFINFCGNELFQCLKTLISNLII